MTLWVEALVAGVDLLSLEDLIARPAWMADALCREHPEVSFFPERGQSTEPAKAICRACAVREECGAFVLTMPSTTSGVWGGTGTLERRRRPMAA